MTPQEMIKKMDLLMDRINACLAEATDASCVDALSTLLDKCANAEAELQANEGLNVEERATVGVGAGAAAGGVITALLVLGGFISGPPGWATLVIVIGGGGTAMVGVGKASDRQAKALREFQRALTDLEGQFNQLCPKCCKKKSDPS